MIRAIGNEYRTPSFYSNKNNVTTNTPNFTGKEAIPDYVGRYMMKGKKKYTGEISYLLLDGKKIFMDFKNGLMQKAALFSPESFPFIKYTEQGLQFCSTPLKSEKLYEKVYKYDLNGELIEITKDGKQIFKKEISFHPYSDTPIRKVINDGKIVICTDLAGKKLSAQITDKNLVSTFTHDGDLSKELRMRVLPNNKMYVVNGQIADYIALPEKEIIINPTNPLLKTEIRIFNEKEQLQKIIYKSESGDVVGTTNIEYNADGTRARSKMVGKSGNSSQELYENDLPVYTEFTRADGETIQKIRRDYSPNTGKKIAESIYNYVPEDGYRKVELVILEDHVKKVHEQIRVNANQQYTCEKLYDRRNNNVLSAQFFNQYNEPISEAEYNKHNRIFVRLSLD